MALAGVFAPKLTEASCDRLFAEQQTYQTGPTPHAVVAGDFNHDGISDLAVAISSADGSVEVLLGGGAGGVGDGSFSSVASYPTGGSLYGVATGDFNGDGIIDLAATDNTGTAAILLGQGTEGVGDGTFASPVRYPAGDTPFAIVAADFNHDGITDLAITNNFGGTVAILTGKGSGGRGDGTFAAPVFYPVGDSPVTAIASGDFNHDGIIDLAVTGQGLSGVAILLGSGSGGVGDGSFGAPTNYPTTGQPFSLAVADFDHDGITDIAIGDDDANGVAILFGNGTSSSGDGTFGPPKFLYNGNQAAAVAAGDWNLDGIPDLAIADDGRGLIAILPGVANGGFGPETDYSVGVQPLSIAVGEFRQDSRPDLAVVNYGSSYVSVLLGGCTSFAPNLTHVEDVPGDQGGKVSITWERSGLDVSSLRAITGYRVWRRINLAGLFGSAGVAMRPIVQADGTEDVTYWEAVATLPAEGLDGYGLTAFTTQDSVRGNNPFTAFFVSALTSDPFVFYESNVDSGYSVDNLPPLQPSLVAAALAPGGVALHWGANRETDFSVYTIYHGHDPSFVPDDVSFLAASPDTGYLDPGGSGGTVYKIAAVDIHGNTSPYVTVAAGTDPAIALALEPVYPNPFVGRDLTVAFTLPAPMSVRLTLLDIQGRAVGELAGGSMTSGRHEVRWSPEGKGRPGVFFVRMEAAGRTFTRRVPILR